jgi:O-acetyl-ADP-ribose deacetylase (regulator of RNase III)
MKGGYEMMVRSTNIVLKQGDITREEVDVIVNAANSGLRGGGGVDGAIHRAGGPSIMAECRLIRERQGGCPTGEAVITTAGDLPARHVVHAVGPVWRGGDQDEARLLRGAYRRSLELAAGRGARTIAFPAISTGVYGYPIELATREALQVAIDFARESDQYGEIRFILFSDADLRIYSDVLAKLEPASSG